MRDAPGKSFGAIIFFVLCVVLVTKSSPAGEKDNKDFPLLGARYRAFEKSCPYSEGNILEKVGEVEEDLERVQEDLKKYKRKRKDESI